MPDSITLEQLQTAQNNFINQRTAEINQLKTDNAAALAALEALSQRVYGYEHDSFAVKDINVVYNDIIDNNSELADLSAIGFVAVLKEGETVSRQGNRMFLNGAEEVEDYTFSPSDEENIAEFVTVWYFSNNGALNFAVNNFNMLQFCIVKSNDDNSTISIGAGNINHAKELILKNYAPSTSYNVEKVVADDFINGLLLSGIPLTNTTRRFSSNVKKLKDCGDMFKNKTALELIDFPELEYIEITGRQMYNLFHISSNAELNFPKLKHIDVYFHGDYGMIQNCQKVILPETLEYVNLSGGKICYGIKQKVVLNCKNLESMPNGWYKGTPPPELEIADDWACSIDLSIVAPNEVGSKWLDKDTWTDLFENTLRNMDDDVREIKIPSVIYDELTDGEFEIAEDKGWTIGC